MNTEENLKKYENVENFEVRGIIADGRFIIDELVDENNYLWYAVKDENNIVSIIRAENTGATLYRRRLVLS